MTGRSLSEATKSNICETISVYTIPKSQWKYKFFKDLIILTQQNSNTLLAEENNSFINEMPWSFIKTILLENITLILDSTIYEARSLRQTQPMAKSKHILLGIVGEWC